MYLKSDEGENIKWNFRNLNQGSHFIVIILAEQNQISYLNADGYDPSGMNIFVWKLGYSPARRLLGEHCAGC